jgi:hypothetical protein
MLGVVASLDHRHHTVEGGSVMTNPWFIVVLVLVVLSLVLAIMDRSFLQPMYLLVLALVVMLGTNAKFPWG